MDVGEFDFDPRQIGPGPFAVVTTPLVDDRGRVGALWWWLNPRYLECDLEKQTCLLGPPLGALATPLQ